VSRLASFFFDLKWPAVACVAAAIFATVLGLASSEGAAYRLWISYGSSLERRLYRLFIFMRGDRIAALQLAAMVVVAGVGITARIGGTLLLFSLAFCAAGPQLWIEQQLYRRREAINAQLDGFLLALSNALKSTPSIGDAFISVQAVTAPPLKQEIELAVKQMRLGSTLDLALLNMAGRIGSRKLDSALSGILMGRQVGGNMPSILEKTAAAMREMARLDGVVRSKTAESKAQMWVLALFPFALMLLFNLVSPGFFDPLTSTTVGALCTTVAFLFWAASIGLARKILAVDI
jgi:tight adherence protein B